MNRLTEIESAIDALAPTEKQELLLFLAARLRAQGNLPEPRKFSPKQIKAWVADDKATSGQGAWRKRCAIRKPEH